MQPYHNNKDNIALSPYHKKSLVKSSLWVHRTSRGSWASKCNNHIFPSAGPLSVTVTLEEEALVAGRSARLQCAVYGSNPAPLITWFKDAVQFPNRRTRVRKLLLEKFVNNRILNYAWLIILYIESWVIHNKFWKWIKFFSKNYVNLFEIYNKKSFVPLYF